MRSISIIASLGLLISSLTAQGAPIEDDIKGEWRADCSKTEGGERDYHIDILSFDGRHFERTLRRFNDRNCTEPAAVLLQEIVGTYSLNPSKLEGASDLTITVEDMFTTPLTDAIVADFVRSRYCSVTEWKRGVRRSIAGQPCSDLKPLRAGAAIYDIVKIADGKLYLGAKSFLHDGSSPEQRPLAFRTLPYIRVSKVKKP